MKYWSGPSVTARLTLLFATVSTSVLLVLGLLIASLVERHFEEMDLDLLEGKLELVSHAVAEQANDSLARRLEAALIGHHGLAIAIWNAEGKTLYASAGAEFPESLLRAQAANNKPSRWTGNDGHFYRGISGSAPNGNSGPAIIAVSTDLAHHEHFMESFRTALWTVVALAALLTGLLGWVAARRGLAPLRTISRDAADITADHLDRRLSTTAIPSELAEVAHTLNAMLARLEASFQRLSDFSSDLAHELRTPVSNLLTQTQVTLSKARSADEYREILGSNAEEFERLSRTIADMLFLAKSDNHQWIPHREQVDLVTEVSSLFEFYEAWAEEQNVRLSCSGNAIVSGDRLMLRRAIGNLLSNAVRHTPARGTVRVFLSQDSDGQTIVAVENDGENIAPEHLPRLFDRFYRADASRRHGGEGSGLGLAITRSIVQAHGGEVSVSSANGLTRFELQLPI